MVKVIWGLYTRWFVRLNIFEFDQCQSIYRFLLHFCGYWPLILEPPSKIVSHCRTERTSASRHPLVAPGRKNNRCSAALILWSPFSPPQEAATKKDKLNCSLFATGFLSVPRHSHSAPPKVLCSVARVVCLPLCSLFVMTGAGALSPTALSSWSSLTLNKNAV